MRGDDAQQGAVFSYVNMEQRIPADHPLRGIRVILDEALRNLSPEFEGLYARTGRPSIAPERLLRAVLLQILFSLRSERQLMEQMNYNLLFRWFVGLGMDDAVWDATVFTKNRERLLQGEIASRLLDEVVAQARKKNLLSEEHFTVDGTLIQAWASRRSFVPKDPPPPTGTGARGRKLLRDTHVSSTDAEARLYTKRAAAEAQPSYLGHVLMENRNGLAVRACATQSSATAEREAALAMLTAMGRREDAVGPATPAITLGGDKAYQEEAFIAALRQRKVVPHVAEYEPNPKWKNWLTPAERQDPGFAISQKKRKLVEKCFGWCKLDRVLRQVKLRGTAKVEWLVQLAATALNLRRMQKLIYVQ